MTSPSVAAEALDAARWRCLAAAAAVGRAAATRAMAASRAAAQWSGGHQATFDGEFAALQARSTDLEGRLLAAAGSLAVAAIATAAIAATAALGGPTAAGTGLRS